MGLGDGNYDSFQYRDEALRAVAKITPSEAMRRYKAVYEYAVKMPRSNGKVASLGCGAGGTHSFRFATEVAGLKAAVVFYGLPPRESEMAHISAPVLGLYGGEDPYVDATIEPTANAMKKLGKSYEQHIYAGATHFFMSYMAEGQNGAAVAAAWPVAVAFLKEHTN